MNDLIPAQGVYTTELTPEIKYYDQLHQEKYRDENQTHKEHASQLANRLSSDISHAAKLFDAIYHNRFLAAGRVQAALGATEREVSPFNCSVSQRIDDDINSIMAAQTNAVKILRLGTGIGFNFSHLRPRGAEIKKLKTESSGPLSFMRGFDVYASTIASSGHRRGAMMGIMNVDHPDIEAFIDAKMEKDAYRQFNLSVGVTDKFMDAVKFDTHWDLSFGGKTYKTVQARYLWEKITRNAYESAEPGIIFIDRLNQNNNLHYCERIEATNPCAEQPLPPYGLCTLGSFNLMAYVFKTPDGFDFNFDIFKKDVVAFVEAYDNIFDEAVYAIPEHREEAINKRRIGLGMTGIANAIEMLLGKPSYGEEDFCDILNNICELMTVTAYDASVELAKKRGPFPLFDPLYYTQSQFIKSLPLGLQRKIELHGIRNSHLISFAPCGTISQCAWNVSSGVEPIFYHSVDRDVWMKEGKVKVTLNDFAYRQFGFKGKTLEDVTIEQHMNVAKTAQRWCDSAISKTVNVAASCSYEEYQNIYLEAYNAGLKGLTVFRPTALRGAVIVKAEQPKIETPAMEIPVAQEYHAGGCVNGACTM